MSEIKQNINIKQGSDKNFGYVFSFIFFLIGFFPLFFLLIPLHRMELRHY